MQQKDFLNDDQNVMVDLETLNKKPGAIILSIGAVQFSEKGLGKEFYTVIDLKSSEEVGLTHSLDTVLWWSRQSTKAQSVLYEAQTPEESLPLYDTLALFSSFLDSIGDDVKLWGNGSDFDNVILAAAYDAVGLDPAWKFYNNRCYRTAKNMLAGPKLERVGTYHNALDDAKSQALHLINLVKHCKQNEPRN